MTNEEGGRPRRNYMVLGLRIGSSEKMPAKKVIRENKTESDKKKVKCTGEKLS